MQEEGWLMGQKEGTNEKGLFPANFTRPIWKVDAATMTEWMQLITKVNKQQQQQQQEQH